MGGAGRGGGLLFLAVLAFVGYQTFTLLEGPARFVATGAILVAAVLLTANVARRR